MSKRFGKGMIWSVAGMVGTAAVVILLWRGVGRALGQAGGAVKKIPAPPPDAHVAAKTPEEAGRYLIMVSGCNDCHTPGYAMVNGSIPELKWLTGNPVGWYGPWGTTYASNLRLLVDGMSEEAWVKMLHERHDRPPMPWSAVNAMSEPDTRAMYRFIKQLGKAGEKMPEPLPPGKEPATPYMSMIPQTPEKK